MRQREAGFTLSEIIVAVAVIAILAGAMTPLILKQIEKSRVSRATAELRAVKIGIAQYYADTAKWPCGWVASDTAIQEDIAVYSCFYEDDSVVGWDGPYVTVNGGTITGGNIVAAQQVSGVWQGLLDPWGNPYQIYKQKEGQTNSANGTVTLYSKGRDGATDTSTAELSLGRASDDDVVILVTTAANG